MKNKIRNRRFGYFYLYFCEMAVCEWKNMVIGRKLSFEVSDNIIWENCYNRIKELPIRTLIYDMHQWIARSREINVAQGDLYHIYNEEILGDNQYIESLLERYPELARLLDLQMEQLFSYFERLLERFQNDMLEIEKMLCDGKQIGKIITVDTGLSDLHEGGNTVSVLTLDNGKKIIYKPHGLRKAILYQELINSFYKECGYIPQEVVYLDHYDYGWEMYIERKACKDEQEAERYFQRMGIQLYVAHLLSATDLHTENIRACGEYPMIVDFETIPGMPEMCDTANADGVIQKSIGSSVLHTGILPVSVWQNHVEGHLSAIHVPEKQKIKLKMPVIEHDRTEDMCIGYQMIEMEAHDSIPKYKEKYLNPVEYQKAFESGFKEAFRCWMNRREQYQTMIYKMYSCEFRIVIRNTQLYAMLNSISLHPEFMKSGVKRKDFIRETLVKYSGKVKQEQILFYEVDCLYNLDIPIFCGNGLTYDLYIGSKICCENFYPKTAFELFRKNQNLYGKTDYQLQQIFIHIAFSELTDFRYEMTEAGMVEISERINSLVSEIADYLLETAVMKDNDISWMKMYGEKPVIYSAMGMDLYDGLPGIALFLAELQKEAYETKYEEIYQKIVAKMFAYTRSMVKESPFSSDKKCTGALIGEGSVIFSYLLLYRVTKKNLFLEYAELHSDILNDIWVNDDKYDFLSGNAGAIYVLTILYEYTWKPQYLDLAEKIGDWLWSKSVCTERGYGWLLEEDSIPLTGMSHGNSGFILAYVRLFEITGNKKYVNIIQKLHQYEILNYDENSGNWLDLRGQKDYSDAAIHTQNSWCHGAPGILIARLELTKLGKYPLMEQLHQDILHGIEALRNSKYEQGMCLCHGRCGNLEIMEEILSYFPDNKQVTEVRDKLVHEILELLEKKSGFRISEWYNPGFMNGISGIGSCLLHVRNKISNKEVIYSSKYSLWI